jgi:hypothetical protein
VITSFHQPDEPPTPKKTGERIYGFLKQKNFGPPFLSFGFPGNLVMYGVLPMIMPVIFTAAYVRLSLSSRNSRSRIALLEADESFSSKLVHEVAALERDMESTIMDMVDHSTGSGLREPMEQFGKAVPVVPTAGTDTSTRSPLATPTGSADATSILTDKSIVTADDPKANKEVTTSKRNPRVTEQSSAQPILSDMQLRMVYHLNKIPQLKKQVVFISQRYSHATIVARDVKMFEEQKEGRLVIQHWADHFVL